MLTDNYIRENIGRYFTEEVLQNKGGPLKKAMEDAFAFLRKEKLTRPAIFIGAGTCGQIAGAPATLARVRNYLSEHSIEADVTEVGCIGSCSSEPVMDVQLPGKARISFHKVYADKVASILDGILNNEVPHEWVTGQFKNHRHEPWSGVPYMDELPFFALQKRIVLQDCGIADPESIEEYLARGGYKTLVRTLHSFTSAKVCEVMEESGLRGRGGGGYSTGLKWKTAQALASDQKYLVCNADESDPGSFMDRALIEGDPHRIIEGIAIAAYGAGASKAYIYLRNEYPLAVRRMKKALKDAREYGFIGSNISDSGVSLSITLRLGPGAFVCGEETALIRSLEGKRGTPDPKPPYPVHKGFQGKPTVVNNVETLANVRAIFENGPAWFRSIGTRTSKGTKIFALSGKVKHTGLAEVPMGTTLNDLIFKIGGGVREDKKIKAVQIGGPSGTCIPAEGLGIPIDYEALKESGAILGSGGLVVMDEGTCMVDIARYFVEFLKNESCGKCIPCREGSRRMLEIFEGIVKRPKDESGHETLKRFKGMMQVEGLAAVIRDTSLCGLGQTFPNPVTSTLKWFREEYEEHIFDRKCRAGVCKELRTFYIDVDKCNGCTACLKKCPVNAIIGSPKMVHFIIEEKCDGCGICYETCKFSAIYMK